jgi:hypothetical protein
MRTLRALAILTKRQMADDGPYLVAALLIPVALIFATAVWAFFDNPDAGMNRYLPVPTVCLLAALVVLICTGSYLFGVRQVHADQASGISPMLSSLSVTKGQILLARTTTGILFLLVVLVFLAFVITGAVLFDILPGRTWVRTGLTEWPFLFLIDTAGNVLVTVFLVALASHYLGLRRASTTSTLLTALDSLPLVLVLFLLVIIKGFTPLSVILLVLLIAGISTSLVDRPVHGVLSIAASGLVECILIGVPLFCGRYLCDLTLASYAASDTPAVKAWLVDLFPPEIRGDKLPTAQGGIHEHYLWPSSYRYHATRTPSLLHMLGLVHSIESRLSRPFPLYRSPSVYHMVRFDAALGQIADTSWGSGLYAGPKGFASAPNESLGRFVSPILGAGILYERRSEQFYSVDFDDRDVRSRGTELEGHTWDPIYIFPGSCGWRMCWVGLDYVPAPYEEDDFRHIAVLDRSGRIALLDRQTLDVLGWIGHLPRPETLFGRGSGRPKDILDYQVALIACGPDARHAGMVVGSLSRQGTSLTLAAFDKDGKEIAMSQSRMGLFRTFPGSTLAIGKYLFESLHPPILTLASFFTAYSFEAGATHRALFLMPNSFVALQRDRETSFIFQFLFALLFLLPALAFAGFLSWRVVRDAALMGLSRRARWLWGLGTLAFGLPAYITYRLVRPKVALALCSDCGRGRRVDQETCHYCGSGWEKAVLGAPAWRVVSP